MEETFVPFRGIKNDLRKRLMCYKQDWIGGLTAGFRYIFLKQLHYKSTYLMKIEDYYNFKNFLVTSYLLFRS